MKGILDKMGMELQVRRRVLGIKLASNVLMSGIDRDDITEESMTAEISLELSKDFSLFTSDALIYQLPFSLLLITNSS